MTAALAANVDWVVNVTTDKAYYELNESPTVTVQVANRGTEDATQPVRLSLHAGGWDFNVDSFTCSNANGDQDAGEIGVGDVTLTLTKPDGTKVTTTTDGDGKYQFTDLPPGNYTVTITKPDGKTLTQVYTVSNPAGIANPTTGPAAVIEGNTTSDVDFGLVQSNVKVNVCINTSDCNTPLVGDTVSWNGDGDVTGSDGSWTWSNVTPKTDGLFSVTVPDWAIVTEVWIDGVKQPTTDIPDSVLSPPNGTVEVIVVLSVKPVNTDSDTPQPPVFESGM